MLVVLAAATITAVLVQVAVNSAAAQKRRLSHDSAVSLAAAVERRVANVLSQDPLRAFTEVLTDEVPRVCSGDLDSYPDAFSAGSDWPASCGSAWSYPGTGNLSSGARVFPPSPLVPVWRVEVFAEVGSERVGYVREFLPGGRDRPMLYAGDALDAGVYSSSLTVSGPVYALGAVDLSSAAVSDGVLVASEVSVTGAGDGLIAGPSGSDDGGAVVRDVFAAPLPSSTLRSSSGELARVGCLDVSPTNVDARSTGLCLRAGRSLVTSGGSSVTFPATGSYEAVLLVPIADGQVRVYTRPDVPAEWPGPLSEWTELGSFLLPVNGLVVTDVSTVLGHCDESAGVCRDWDGDGSPGSLVDDSFTVVVGTPSDPVDLRFGGPISAGSGRVGAVVSGLVRLPTAASPAGSGLVLDAWLAVLGRPGEVSFASEGGSARPSVSFEGALLLADFSVDLSGFAVSSVSVPARSDAAPPLFPSPGLLASSDAARRTSAADLDALFLAGEASGFSVPSAPGLLGASPGDVSVVLSWSAPLGDGGVTLLDYVVEYRETGASTWSAYTDLVGVDLSASVVGLVNGTAYEFRVAAVNGVGRGPFSGTLSATPFLAPSAPTGLTVSVVPGSETSLSLSWDAVTNVTPTGYHVYRLNPVSGLYELVASPASNSYVDVGLSSGVAYSYKVSAFTLSGEGSLSAVASQTVPDPSPEPPTITSVTRGNLSVTAAFSSSSTPDRPVEGFKFFRDGVLVATSSDPALVSYTFGGLVGGTSYVFGVAAFNSSGDSATVTETVTAASTPDAVSSLTVVPEEGVPQSLVLSWSPPANVTPEGFYVYRENVVSGIFEVVATVSDSSYVDSGLDVGELYSYRVSAFLTTLEGGLSSTVSETAIDVPFDAVVLGSSVGDLEVTLDFVVDSSPGRPLDEYKVFQDGIEIAAVDPGSGSYVFTGLVDGFTYEFSVLGYNRAGEGVADSVLVTAYAVPAQVTGLQVTPTAGSSTSLDMVWDVPLDAVLGFYVERLNALSGIFEVVATVPSAAHVDTGLLESTSYTYRVSAFGDAGTGPVSAHVLASTASRPGMPTALDALASAGEISLTWATPLVTGTGSISDYVVQFDQSAAFSSPVTFADGVSVLTSATVTGLVNGTSYWFRVAAVGDGGTGDFSESVTSVPLAAAPALVNAAGSSDDLVYCGLASDCSGLSPAVGSGETFRFVFVGDASSTYHVQALEAVPSSDPDQWFASSTELAASFSVTGGSLSGGAGQRTIATTSAGTVTVDATGASLRDRPVFFKITETSAAVASGGVPVSDPAYTDVLAVYTTAQTTSFVAPGSGTVDFLVVAGGGSGGHGHSSAYGGSGGAGGYRTSLGSSGGGGSAESKLTLVGGNSYTVTVGAGGIAPTTDGVRGSSGGNSVFASITSTGGGAGSGTNSGATALTGGSGGGGSYATNPSGASGTAGQGYAGGAYNTGGQPGFGGGAGSAGTTSAPGVGVASSITGSSVTRAAGGSGAGAAAPSTNSGSGGSGGRTSGAGGPLAASGGSGLVVVRYQR